MNSTSPCADILRATEMLPPCVQTEHGAKFTTHCLYPSFDQVSVYVVRLGEGYEIHDGGGAVRSAWDHGREISAARKIIAELAAPHQLKIKDDVILASVESLDWLVPAILTVANVSAEAARSAVSAYTTATENVFKEMIYSVISKILPKRAIGKEFPVRGVSGKTYRFDYVYMPQPSSLVLMDAVSPHHISIASKYVAFSDTKENETVVDRLAICERPLEHDDESLLLQVAQIVPFENLEKSVKRSMTRWTKTLGKW